MKTNKIFYWIFTILISLWMLLQGVIFTFMQDTIVPVFESLGFPLWLIAPLGIAKILAVIAILSNKSAILKQLAYVGLAVEFAIALISHLMVGDNQWPVAVAALLILGGSYIFGLRIKR
ncbi:DoxX family protein [Ekhidna sp.]|uniref:DoxX family protein n=1 Tax=Ekhidna sp. TaxID=2608089 RepID=UPI003BAA5B37